MQQKTDRLGETEYLNFIDTSLAVIGVRENEIIEIRFKLDDYEVDVYHQMEIHDAFLKLTNNGHTPYHILVIPGRNGSITKEAREMEMFETAAFKKHYSLTIVVQDLSTRILSTFYFSLKKSKPNYPCRLFESEELAIKWVLK